MYRLFALLAPIGFLTVAAPHAAAQETNVFVRLYLQRVALAEADVKREAAETAFQSGRLARARYLLDRQAISREEYERTEADYKMSVAEGEVLTAKLGEAVTMVEVVRSLVQSNETVPICRP